jgi:hypothetical protein
VLGRLPRKIPRPEWVPAGEVCHCRTQRCGSVVAAGNRTSRQGHPSRAVRPAFSFSQRNTAIFVAFFDHDPYDDHPYDSARAYEAQNLTGVTSLKPEAEDIVAVEDLYGPLSATATDEQRERRYRLAQERKLRRLYETGRLPPREVAEVAKFVGTPLGAIFDASNRPCGQWKRRTPT